MSTTTFPIELVPDDVRLELAAKILVLDARAAALKDAGGLDAKAEAALDAELAAILRPHDLHFAGWCECCNRLLFAGENGGHDREAIMTCEECTPTYGEWKADLDNGLYDDDEEVDKEKCLADIQAHLDGGGSLTDKMTVELDAE